MQTENQLKSCYKIMLSSREVVARDLPHPMPLSLLNRKQQPYFMREVEDPGQKISGMTPNFMGFTLIELLVVVLIIGILAAVALPQYQKAVEKSRGTQALIILKTAYDAAKAYQLANGYWPTDFDELSVDIPWTGTENWQKPGEVRPGRSNGEWSIQFQRGSTGEGNAISIGRLKGKYQGAGFYISSTPEDPLPKDEIFCVEYRNTNYSINPFTQGTGSYCNKIFKAKRIQTSHNGSMDYFRMP